MTARFVKTDAGREAIRSRAATLSRPARNLLLIIDDSKIGNEWVTLVNGAAPADLELLFNTGLVAEVASQPRPPAMAPEPAAPAWAQSAMATGLSTSFGYELEDALQRLSYRELYDRLTSEARPRLGLIKGLRTVLEIEKCSGPEEIRRLAVRFIADLRTAQGDTAARDFCRSIGAEV